MPLRRLAFGPEPAPMCSGDVDCSGVLLSVCLSVCRRLACTAAAAVDTPKISILLCTLFPAAQNGPIRECVPAHVWFEKKYFANHE